MIILINRLAIVFIITLLFMANVKAHESDDKNKLDVYKDSIHTSLNTSELKRATGYALTYLELVKKEFSRDRYLSSIELLYTCYIRQNKYKESFELLTNEGEWVANKNNKFLNLYLQFKLGKLFKEMNDDEKAIEYFLKLNEGLEEGNLSTFTNIELAISKINIYTELAYLLISADPGKSLTYINNAKIEAEVVNDSSSIAYSYLDRGWVFLEMGEYSKAELDLDSSFVLFDKIGSNPGQAKVLLEQGILLEHKHKLEEALQLFLKSYDLLYVGEYKFKSYFLRQKILKLISQVYFKQQEYEKALQYASEHLDLVTDYKDRKQIAYIAKTIAEIYEKKNETKQALEYYKLSNENYEILKFEDSRIDILRKEHRYAERKNDAELSGVKTNLKSEQRRNVYLVFSLLLLGVLSVLFIRKKRNQDRLKDKTLKEKEDIIFKRNQSMAQMSLSNQSKNQFIGYLQNKLQFIYNASGNKSPELKKLILQLKRSVNKEEEWSRFRKYHMEIEPVFYQEIQKRWPHLTNLDIRHCTLLKLNMSNSDAAEVLGISPKSVQMARYRLKKKLNYESQVSLRSYIASI